ncbi:hypothetical protein [Streptomyces sp. HC307]|uniref:hypothetical protein n=1 Tax=Streptomyces flavusporus TaxID=3385496 RepID=UPI0039170DA3
MLVTGQILRRTGHPTPPTTHLVPHPSDQTRLPTPPGALLLLLLSYFNGAHATGPAITLALWAAVAALLLGLRPRLMRRRAAAAA